MAFMMESESIKSFLLSMGLEKFVDLFKEHELELDVLKTLSEVEVKDVLKEIGIPLGHRLRISKKIKDTKADGKYMISSLLELHS